MAIFGKKTTEETKEEAKKASEKKAPAKKGGTKDLYKDQKPASKSNKKVEGEKKTGNAYRILVKPLITEKAANQAAEGKYAFAVDQKANKIEIAKAITEVYGVKVTKVNVTHVSGKKVRHGRHFGYRKDWKKAIVTLEKGKTINIYEGV